MSEEDKSGGAGGSESGDLRDYPGADASRRQVDEINRIALHCASLPVLDDRSADEILGYDEIGLPR